jgi:hypothetical protein
VHEGHVRDAILHATSCNLHGKPLTNADKRRRVLALLQDPEWCGWSDGAIARHCGVTQPFVSSIRRSLKTVLSDEAEQVQTSRTYTDRHGHTSTMDTRKIGQRAPEPRASGDAARRHIPQALLLEERPAGEGLRTARGPSPSFLLPGGITPPAAPC